MLRRSPQPQGIVLIDRPAVFAALIRGDGSAEPTAAGHGVARASRVLKIGC
jgi:hypothetical protein